MLLPPGGSCHVRVCTAVDKMTLVGEEEAEVSRSSVDGVTLATELQPSVYIVNTYIFSP